MPEKFKSVVERDHNKEYDFLKKIIKHCVIQYPISYINPNTNCEEEQIAVYSRFAITQEELEIINSLRGRMEVQ